MDAGLWAKIVFIQMHYTLKELKKGAQLVQTLQKLTLRLLQPIHTTAVVIWSVRLRVKSTTLMIELVVICQFLSRNVKYCKCSIFSVLNAWMQWIHNNARQRQVYNWHVNTVTSAITTINMAFVAFDFMLQWSHLWCGLKIILCVKRKCTD